MNPLVKLGQRLAAKRHSCKQLHVVPIATTAGRHWGKRGNVVRTVYDDAQEPKLSVETDMGLPGVSGP